MSVSLRETIVPRYHTMQEGQYYEKYAKKNFPIEKDDGFKFDQLDVNLPIDRIAAIFEESNDQILQLRELELDKKVLIIGCGQRPISNSAGYSIYGSLFEGDTIDGPIYRETHAHPNAITIDPDLAKNAHLVAYFGRQKLTMLPSHHFDVIMFEGINPPLMQPYTISELERLIAPGGKIIDDADYVFTFENLKKGIIS